MVESEKVEFKREVTRSFAKEAIGFANAAGGTVYVGVSDEGVPLGVADADSVMQQVASILRDSVVPDVMPLVHISALGERACLELFGAVPSQGPVVAVEVARGASQPYYLASKGPTPAGVFVREGVVTAPASRGQIIDMIGRAAGYSFEQELSLEQNLSFEAARRVFLREGMRLGRTQMRTIGLINEDGLYTNLGLILSDQCPLALQAATFQGTDVMTIRDRRLFEGPLFGQIDQLLEYLSLRNDTSGVIGLRDRVEVRSYPEKALREAVLNMVMHRDYASAMVNKVSVFDDRIEFLTAGGLARGIHEDEVTSGTSVCRNPRLADVLFRLKLVEAYGMGMPRIYAAYKGEKVQPIVEVSPHVFKLTLPNLNYVREHGVPAWAQGDGASLPSSPGSALRPLAPPRTRRPGDVRHMILNIVESNGSITRLEIEQVFGISRSSAGRIVDGMVLDGLLEKRGAGRSTTYVGVA